MKKIYKSILLGLSLSIFSLSVTSCNNNNEENKFIESDNDRVFYEIFTSSFSDSNGDGIGDLKGICNRLDYLNDGNQTNGSSLGIQGIWLTPIFQSPSYHKYDATDYYTIDKTLGTKDDLTNLVNECHKRNIKLILDLAINHTATNSEWFKNFVKAHQNNDTESKWYDWYTWSNDTSDTSRAWKKITNASHYYECNFDSSMPELNFDNASVKDELLNVAKYWLDLGVDGFRFDAAKYIYYGDDKKTAQFWDEYIKELKSYKENIYTVAEVWNEDGSIEKYAPYINCFNFQMAQSEGYIGLAARGQAISKYTTYVSSFNQNLKTINSDGRLISFQSNHDTNRVANWLIDENQYKMAANLYLLTPGSPFVYYGEEIRMMGSRGSESTDANRRLAMLWGDGDTIKDPTGSTWYSSGKKQNGTVAEQLENESSTLNYYKKLIALRNKYPLIAKGTYASLSIPGSTIGGFRVEYENQTYFLIHNNKNIELSINLSSLGNNLEILDSIGVNSASIDNETLTIGAYTSILLK